MRYKSRPALIESIRTEHDARCSKRYRRCDTESEACGAMSGPFFVTLSRIWRSGSACSWGGSARERRGKPQMPAPGYKWSETPKLNRAIWAKHRSRNPADVRTDFDSGYRQILALVEESSPEGLLTPGHFEWTGKHPLTTYLGPNTASHYRFAI